jgi:hypothetical protein
MTVVEQTPPAEAKPNAGPEPESGSTDSGSMVAVVMDFVGATLPHFDRLLESMRLHPGGPGLTGSLFQWSRRTLDGVRVTEVWQSRDLFDFFFREEIEPLLSAAGLREPEITTYEVHTYLTQGPNAAQPFDDDVFGYAHSSTNGESGRPLLDSTEGR